MRVSINVDEQGGPQVDAKPAPTESLPSAELAERAEAMGAISAGPAPSLGQGQPPSGAPAITPGIADQTSGDFSGAVGSHDLSAGAAPGQPDHAQTVSEEEK